MSGLIKNLKEEIGSSKEGSDSPKTINLAIKIESYEDGKYAIGARVDNNEKVKVFLRDVEVKNHDRIDISALSSQNHKYKALPDGNSVVLFESAYQEDDGTWNARWVKILSNKKWPSKVFALPSSVQIVNYQNNKFLSVDVIKKISRLENKDPENIKRFVVEGLKPKMLKMTPVVSVRITDSIGDSLSYNFYAKKEVVNEHKQIMQPNEYIDELWNKERFQKILNSISDPEIVVDVIYITQMNFGADTNEKIVKNNFEMTRIQEEYSSENNDKLYKNTILSLRERDDGSMFLISANAVQNNEKGINIENV